ncbi:MAG: hypothetical protein M3198_04020 [Actinomycetota bacterium]|nr:hypothetical protein [Actinomycetota bacterium]
MAKAESGKSTGSTLSTDTVNGHARDKGDGEWVTLRRAAEETGVSISTLRSWYRKGLVDSRVEKGPNGSQRMVRLAEITSRARRDNGREAQPAPGPGTAAFPGELRELIAELASARERAGRAEARADFLAQELADLRSAPREAGNEHARELDAENRMLRERLELMRVQAEDMARRLSAIEGVPDEIDLDADEEPGLPPEEEDEFLAVTQRWKARRLRRKAARRSARSARS